MVYLNCKVYGPYIRKNDGRQHVVIIWPDKKRQTVSYPKYLTEIRLNRYLNFNETVDHIDGNFNNNYPNNIQILNRKIHSKQDARKLQKQEFICPRCGIKFELESSKLSHAIQNRKKGRTGPFCSRRCAGIYGKAIQEGYKKLLIKNIKPKYTIK